MYCYLIPNLCCDFVTKLLQCDVYKNTYVCDGYNISPKLFSIKFSIERLANSR